MTLQSRSGFVLLAVLACAACQDDKDNNASTDGLNGSQPPVAGNGASNTTSPGDKPGSANTPAAGSGSSTPTKPGKPGEPGTNPSLPLTGATDFNSADPSNTSSGLGTFMPASRGSASGSDANTAGAPPAAMSPTATAGEASSSTRAVERGDIYRVLDDHRILNLNAYRGLQVIDVSNVDAPRLEGRLAATGTPLEMYVVGQRAIVLLNDWQGYYGARDDVKVESVSGGLVLNVDISNRAQPKLLSQAIVKGSITTSRLTQGDGQAALYVAANVYQQAPTYTNTTLVKSFDVSGDGVTPKSEIDLGGYVQDVQATGTDLMLVSSIDYNKQTQQSTVAVIDISRPDGTMVRGGSVTARGIVENKFNMDAYNGVLRVVSGSTWSGTRENHLETFSLADLAQPKALGHCAFGGTEQLYATIFVENKGFFVTYLRTDPFHAFSIDDQGRCEEHNQYIVSGWNDFLRPTLGGTRLIGVGSNDTQQRRTVSISLYDTTNIDNPTPMLARADLALDNSYSEAQWDDRAFSVIEDAVNVKSGNGTTETGLILVPFQGYVQNDQRYVSQVQILTFSDRTLTRRGVMDHGTAVRRSFLANDTTAANLSDEELKLYSIADPNAPAAKGSVEVAPNYREVHVFGDYVARVHDPSLYFGWNGSNVTPPAAHVEVVPRSGDAEASNPVASIDVPSNAKLVRVGDLLISVVTTLDSSVVAQTADQQKWNTHIDAYDFSDPAHPSKRGSLDTDRIRPSYGNYYPVNAVGAARGGVATDAIACFDCRPRGAIGTQYVVGDAVVFATTTQQQKSLGIVHRCSEYVSPVACAPSSGTGAKPACGSSYTGGISCVTYKGQPEQCTGSFYECPSDGGACKPYDGKLTTERSCYDGEEFRFWQAYAFDALDVRDPDHLVLADRVSMDTGDEGTSVYTNGDALFFNFQHQHGATNDPARAYVKRFFKRIGYADPQSASVGPAINIPGDVIAADGETIYTRDWVWEDQDPRTLVARLTIDKDLAYLQASRVFSERMVSAIKLDGAGHVLVSSDSAYPGGVGPVAEPGRGVPTSTADQPQHKLSILDSQTLEVSGETDVDTWATFQDATNGRALFSVSGGLLVINVEDPAKPAAQAYFATLAWPNAIYFDGHEAMFAGGPYGIYRFDTDVFNLLMK